MVDCLTEVIMLKQIRKGDIVARISHNKDVVFVVDKVINNKIVWLTGITTRLKADAPIDDVEVIEKSEIQKIYDDVNKKIKEEANSIEIERNNFLKRSDKVIYTGKILHLDGDKRYSEKSNMYYRKMGLRAIVRNVPEYRQSDVVNTLIDRYNPDILVVTGHDGMLKKGKLYEDLYNYRNSRFFAQTVINARRNEKGKKLVIFAGACQSYYEALISAGANFASSPARILIDFMDPLVVARKIATTDSNKFLTIGDIEDELRDGERGINRSRWNGKEENFYKIVTKM